MDHLLKDKILHFLNNNPNIHIGTSELSQKLDADQKEIVRVSELINGEYGETVRIWPGIGDDLKEISFMPQRKAFVAHFLSQGGFTAAFESQQATLTEEAEIRTLYKENLRLSTQAQKDAQSSAKSAKRSERITLIMTIVSAIIAAISAYISWRALK